MKLGLTTGLSLVVIGLSACGSDTNPPAIDSGGGGGGSGVDSSTADGATSGNCDGIIGEGFEVGQIADNWTSLDRDGNPVSLYEHCGKVILYENGAEW